MNSSRSPTYSTELTLRWSSRWSLPWDSARSSLRRRSRGYDIKITYLFRPRSLNPRSSSTTSCKGRYPTMMRKMANPKMNSMMNSSNSGKAWRSSYGRSHYPTLLLTTRNRSTAPHSNISSSYASRGVTSAWPSPIESPPLWVSCRCTSITN